MTHPLTPLQADNLERITVDFNNRLDDDIVLASTRRSKNLSTGQQVVVVDPGEPQTYIATVESITGRTIRLQVEWENYPTAQDEK
jgi:hypothetical protein